MADKSRPSGAVPDEFREESIHDDNLSALTASPGAVDATRGHPPPGASLEKHTADRVAKALLALLPASLFAGVVGKLWDGSIWALTVIVLAVAATTIVYFVSNDNLLLEASKYRFTMLASVLAALIVPVTIIMLLLLRQTGTGYTLIIATATAVACAVLLIAALRVSWAEALISCGIFIVGAGTLLFGVAVLLDVLTTDGLTPSQIWALVLLGVGALLAAVGLLLLGVWLLVSVRWLAEASLLLGAIGSVLFGVACLVAGLWLMAGGALLLSVVALLAGVDARWPGIWILLFGGVLLVSIGVVGKDWAAGIAFLLVGVGVLLALSLPPPGVGVLLAGVCGLLAGVVFLVDGDLWRGFPLLLIGITTAVLGIKGHRRFRSFVSYWFREKS